MRRLGRRNVDPVRLVALLLAVAGLSAISLEAAFCSNANGATYAGPLQAPRAARQAASKIAGTRPGVAQSLQGIRQLSALPMAAALCIAAIGGMVLQQARHSGRRQGPSKKANVRLQATADSSSSYYPVNVASIRTVPSKQATQLIDLGCDAKSCLPTASAPCLAVPASVSSWSNMASLSTSSESFVTASSRGEGKRKPRAARHHQDRQKEERRHIGAKLLLGSSGKLEVQTPSFDPSKVRLEIQVGLRSAACAQPRAVRDSSKRSEKLAPISSEWGTTSLAVMPPNTYS